MKKKSNKLSLQVRWLKTGLLLCFLSLGAMSVSAQSKTITGHVQDSNKQPLSGVSVVVKGTTNGTMADMDGNYSLSTKVGDVIVASFIGMKPFTFTVGSANKVNIVLQDDVVALGGADGVTVVGYGSAKTKDLTSNIPTVKGDELSKHLTASAMSGMQGKVAGVQIVNSGAPGSSPTVHIRGIGNYDNTKTGPLYVVDGMLYDDITFLSSSDIQSMTVLKDASSAAIYGVRAANGVIIITTKKGLQDTKPKIVYDGSWGFQKASNMVAMASSAQYTQIMRDAYAQEPGTIGNLSPIDKSISLYGDTNGNKNPNDPNNTGIPGTNTNWYNSMLRTAMIQNHSINITGGGKETTYALGVNYLNQDGIANFDNGYKRVNTRAKFDTKITNWLKMGANIVISNSTKTFIDREAFSQAFRMPNIMPIYDGNNTTQPNSFESAAIYGLGEGYYNPYATAYYSSIKDKQFNENNNTLLNVDSKSNSGTILSSGATKGFQVMPAFFAEAKFLDDKLTLRSSFNQNVSFNQTKEYIPQYAVDTKIGDQHLGASALENVNENINNWVADNTATYQDSYGKHSFTAMIGNSIRRERWIQVASEARNVPQAAEIQYLSQGTNQNARDYGTEYRGLSYFTRGTYNYADKYLASVTMRMDGSSKYQEKWGYFPSFGAGWVISRENFMANQHVFDNLKLRANWGKLGNDKIPANNGFATASISTGSSAVFGNGNSTSGTIYPGIDNVSFYSRLRWEVVQETDLGFDFAVLNNRLTGSMDYYNRTTQNAVFSRPVPLSGEMVPTNNGSLQNSGMEFTLNWNDQVGKDFNYNFGFNMSTLKNKVTKLDGLQQIVSNDRIRKIGEPVDSYYGYKVIGIYQNAEQIANDPLAVKQNLKPGDFIFEHQKNETSLTAADRQILGSPIPTLYLGGNIALSYKNWDFNLSYQGQYGQKIFNSKRRDRGTWSLENFDKNLADHLWTGDGSTNSYPSASALVGSHNAWNVGQFSSFFIENANTFSIQNIQLGYTFRNIIKSSENNASLRLSLTAERPFNFFSYNGFTTDIPDGNDNATYPLASTYSFGIKLIY